MTEKGIQKRIAKERLAGAFVGSAASRPWKMCRSCHRIGTQRLWASDRCEHESSVVGNCGQCGKKRPLVECHRYDFRPPVDPRHQRGARIASDTVWAIRGEWSDGDPFLYTGTWLTRREAIEAHTTASGRSWRKCRRAKDRAVRVRVTETPTPLTKRRSRKAVKRG